jgi:hypothetical protein
MPVKRYCPVGRASEMSEAVVRALILIGVAACALVLARMHNLLAQMSKQLERMSRALSELEGIHGTLADINSNTDNIPRLLKPDLEDLEQSIH